MSDIWEARAASAAAACALAPSTNDAAFYRSWLAEGPLGAAWLTNGFDSIHIPQEQLAPLAAAAAPAR